MTSLSSIHVPTQIKCATRWRLLLYLSFVLAAFGAKLWIIARYGNATPFWDEWDAQAVILFIPYYDSTLSLQNFLTPDNEHRLLTDASHVSRVDLGKWIVGPDPADDRERGDSRRPRRRYLDGFRQASRSRRVCRTCDTHRDARGRAQCDGKSARGASNTFLLRSYCLAACAIFLIVGEFGFSALRILGIAAAALSFLSLASGALVFLACGGVVITKRVLRVESGWRPWAFAAVLLACFVLALSVTPTIAAHKVFAAHSAREFLIAFLRQASWPIRYPLEVSALVVNAPLVMVAWRTLRKPPPSNNIAWVLLALGLWNALQFAALAYGRAAMSEASRYLDIRALGLIINFICAAIISDTGRKRLLAASWVVAIVIGWAFQTAIDVPKQLQERYSTSVQQEKNVQSLPRHRTILARCQW